MTKKIFGAFYEVAEERKLDFTDIFAVGLELGKCGKGDLRIEFTDKEEKQGFFIGGHAEANNKPEVTIYKTPQVFTIKVEQEEPIAEGLLHLTLRLPKKKFSAVIAVGKVMEYNLIKNGEINYINLANVKGNINVEATSNHVCLYSKYYDIDAKITATDGKNALYQIASRAGNVNISLKNIGELIVHEPPEEEKYVNKFKPTQNGVKAELYFKKPAEGQYTIQ